MASFVALPSWLSSRLRASIACPSHLSMFHCRCVYSSLMVSWLSLVRCGSRRYAARVALRFAAWLQQCCWRGRVLVVARRARYTVNVPSIQPVVVRCFSCSTRAQSLMGVLVVGGNCRARTESSLWTQTAAPSTAAFPCPCLVEESEGCLRACVVYCVPCGSERWQ